VGQRQVEIGEILVLDDADLVDHVQHRPVVAVADDAALRRPGRAGGVDEGADVLGRDRRVERLPGAGVATGAFGAEVLHRDRVLGAAGHHHHVLELRQAVAHRSHLLQLFCVLDDDDLGVGVLEDVAALLGGVGLVDRHHRGADRERGEIEVGPLRPRVAEDRDPVALLDSEGDEAEGERPHDLDDLGVAATQPLVAVLEPDRGFLPVELRRSGQEIGDRARVRPSPRHCGRSLVQWRAGGEAWLTGEESALRSEVSNRVLSMRPWKIGTPSSTHFPITSCRSICIWSASSAGVR
jgi:hypothetical protein